MLVQDLSVALEAVSAAAEPWVGSAWREVPTFMLFFGLLFLVSFVLWYYVVGVDRRKAAVLASCVISTVHGSLVALGGYEQLLNWPSFQVDMRNTLQQKLLNEFSLGYMVADMLFFLLPFTPDDVVFMIHHSISAIYLVGCLLNGHGAIGCIMMFFLGEVTSPVFNVFSVSKELRHRYKAAQVVFDYTSPLFTVAFVGVRSIISPPVVAWFVFTVWFRAKLIPTPWRIVMGSCVALGMVASQIWSYRLLRGYLKRRRRVGQLAQALDGKKVE
ncbi:TLC domain-containing protein [Chlorella vulgaris]